MYVCPKWPTRLFYYLSGYSDLTKILTSRGHTWDSEFLKPKEIDTIEYLGRFHQRGQI